MTVWQVIHNAQGLSFSALPSPLSVLTIAFAYQKNQTKELARSTSFSSLVTQIWVIEGEDAALFLCGSLPAQAPVLFANPHTAGDEISLYSLPKLTLLAIIPQTKGCVGFVGQKDANPGYIRLCAIFKHKLVLFTKWTDKFIKQNVRLHPGALERGERVAHRSDDVGVALAAKAFDRRGKETNPMHEQLGSRGEGLARGRILLIFYSFTFRRFED